MYKCPYPLNSCSLLLEVQPVSILRSKCPLFNCIVASSAASNSRADMAGGIWSVATFVLLPIPLTFLLLLSIPGLPVRLRKGIMTICSKTLALQSFGALTLFHFLMAVSALAFGGQVWATHQVRRTWVGMVPADHHNSSEQAFPPETVSIVLRLDYFTLWSRKSAHFVSIRGLHHRQVSRIGTWQNKCFADYANQSRRLNDDPKPSSTFMYSDLLQIKQERSFELRCAESDLVWLCADQHEKCGKKGDGHEPL
jgi:hypothetical protein